MLQRKILKNRPKIEPKHTMLETELVSQVPISLVQFFGILIFGTLSYAAFSNETGKAIIIFCYNCFLKPFEKANKTGDQQADLESFYKNQASIYDQTRKILLKGREQALQLAVSHLLASHPTGKDLVWIDIGGGTGSNLEFMRNVYSINRKNFRKIYMIDYSLSLCDEARRKFSSEIESGIVEIMCSDASKFDITGLNKGGVDLFTFSYSLSMIPNYYSTIDHLVPFVNKEHGIVCSVDFGTQSGANSVGRVDTLGGLVNRNGSWLTRHFWSIWFEFDKVHLDPSRRNYLEYRFGTLKSLNMRNKPLGNIPYYVWIGCDKLKCANLIEKINAFATESPYLLPQAITSNSFSHRKLSNTSLSSTSSTSSMVSKGHEAALENQKKGLPYPSVYYQKDVTRVYYDELNPLFDQFNNQYIYAFTWEDPREDMNLLNIGSDDSILAITSAGDNLLHYACLPKPPRKIHGVDLNPCQNHLLELKLACFKAKLAQHKIWQLFGEGKLEDKSEFMHLLIEKLSPHMSSNALQYWVDKGPKTFSPMGNGLYYDTGSTRWALKLARWVFAGLSKDVDKMCLASTIKEQKSIYEKNIKPTLFNPFLGKLLIGNSLFLWKALGVPINQANMIQGLILNYIIDTLDPIVNRSLLSKDNYFYYLCLQAKYAKDNCPAYLSDEGYSQLTKKKDNPVPNFRLHTDTLNDVLKRLASSSLTIIIIMDHMDWFDPNGPEAEEEIGLLNKALSNNGRVMLRSASTEPWYIKIFDSNGFVSEPAAVRKPGSSIDRCNMYASTWICTKRAPLRSFSTSSDATISSLRI